MRYFLDFEFLEDDKGIEPMSLGIVAEDGRELYLQFIQSDDFDSRLSPWVRENVLPHMTASPWVSRVGAQQTIRDFIGTDPAVELWGYYCDYDFVILSRLLGGFSKWPDGWPFLMYDLRQHLDAKQMRNIHQPDDAPHHGLMDARWIADTFRQSLQGECVFAD